MQIIILGMHRSGTSAVSRLVNMMGAYFAPEEKRMAAAPENPKGFWERTDVMHLNNEILNAAGGSWDQVSQLDLEIINGPDREKFGGRINDILLEMDAHRPWSLKDPRMCLTLPVWRDHLEIPLFLFVSRNPVQVARSLEKRNGIPLFVGVALWEYYTVNALDAVKDEKVIFTRYEDVMRDPVEATASIYKNLNECGVNGLKMPDREEIEAFISADFFHHRDNNNVLDEYLNANQLNLVQFLQENPDIRRLPPLKVSTGSLEALKSYSLQILQSKGLKTLENEKNDIRSELKQVHLDLDTAATEISGLRSAFAENEKVKDEKSIFSTQAKTVARLKDQLSEKEIALVEISAVNDSQSKRIKILEREKDDIQNEKKKAQADLRSAIVEVSRLNQILQQKEGVIRDKETQQEAIQKEVVHLKDQLSEKKIALAEILTTCKEQNNQINYIRKEKVEKALAAAIQIEKKTKTSAVSLEGGHTQIREALVTLKSILNELIQQSKSKDDIIFSNIPKIEEKLSLLLSNERQKFIGNCRKAIPSRFLLRLAGCVIHPRRTFSYFHDRKIVLNSEYFDENYYLQNNYDVLLNYADPVEHFCLYGWKEGRNPHPSFDVGFYLSNNSDVAQAKINPLVHFELHGLKEGRQPSNRFDVQNNIALSQLNKWQRTEKMNFPIPCQTQSKAEPGRYGSMEEYEKTKEKISKTVLLKPAEVKLILIKSEDVVGNIRKLKFQSDRKTPEVSILIPVYNAVRELAECLASIYEHVKCSFEIVIADDCSTDKRIFEAFHNHSSVNYLRNQRNLGFLMNVNNAVSHCKGNYILLLNSDVQLLDDCVTILQEHLKNDSAVKVVGPRIIYPNGILQEAGCSIRTDCTTQMIGLGSSPGDPRYSFDRYVDYISGACLFLKNRISWILENLTKLMHPPMQRI